MKRLLIYDLDGTLIDTKRDIAEAVNVMLQTLQRPPLSVDAVWRSVGHGVQQLVAGCLDTADPARIQQGLELFHQHYTRHFLDHSRLYPGASALLEHFATSTQVILTNKPDPYTRPLLAHLGLTRYVAEVISAESGYPKKPDPAAVQALMSRYATTASEVVLIGDSAIDVETGHRAGVPTVLVLHGLRLETIPHAATLDAQVDDLTQLLTLAKRRSW